MRQGPSATVLAVLALAMRNSGSSKAIVIIHFYAFAYRGDTIAELCLCTSPIADDILPSVSYL